jgi:hypothetical protein
MGIAQSFLEYYPWLTFGSLFFVLLRSLFEYTTIIDCVNVHSQVLLEVLSAWDLRASPVMLLATTTHTIKID